MPAVGSGSERPASPSSRRRRESEELLLDDVGDLADAALEDRRSARTSASRSAGSRTARPVAPSRSSLSNSALPAGSRSRVPRGPDNGASIRVYRRAVPRATLDRREVRRMATATSFTGFRPEALRFLFDLAGNNERSWFQPRKADYERLLKEPLEALCVALDERFEALDLPLEPTPSGRRSGSIATSASARTSRHTRRTSARASRGSANAAERHGPLTPAERLVARTSTVRGESSPAAGCGIPNRPGWPPSGRWSTASPIASGRPSRSPRSSRRSGRSAVNDSRGCRRAIHRSPGRRAAQAQGHRLRQEPR